MMETYDDSTLRHDVAEICENGHVISTAIRANSAKHEPFCATCGAPTIVACPKCDATIRGESNAMYDSWRFPNYCVSCSAAFPWTTRGLKAASELVDLSTLSTDQKRDIKAELPELAHDTARTKVAALKVGRFMKSVAPEIAAAMREILVNIATEAAKKQMGPSP